MIEFIKDMPAPAKLKLQDELSKFDGENISDRFRRLINRSRFWFASSIGVDSADVDVIVGKLDGTYRDRNRDIHIHPSVTYASALSSRKILQAGTILLDGLTQDDIDHFYSEAELIERFKEKKPINPDVEDIVYFSRISRNPSLLPEFRDRISLFQPDNGQIVAFDVAHAAPSLPANTSRLLFVHGGN
jgi:hypothetical protein